MERSFRNVCPNYNFFSILNRDELIIKEKIAFSNITLGSASSKLPFTLIAAIKEISDTKSEVQLTFDGTFNPMMTMMVKKPLTKFIDILTENIFKTTISTSSP